MRSRQPVDIGLPVFPKPPILTSKTTGWREIQVEYHHQPAYEIPESSYERHIIGIHIGRPTATETWSEQHGIERRQLLDGDICIFPAHVRNWERSYQESEFVDLYLNPGLLSQVAYESIVGDRVELQFLMATRDPLIQHIGLALKKELELQADLLYAESMANALGIHLLRRYSTQQQAIAPFPGGLSPRKLRQAIDYIHQQLEQELTVTAIASHVRLSPYHFSRLFKQATGLTPYQYVIQCRVNWAKELLIQGEMEIAEVADRVGFSSQSHLNRHFKKLLGITPKSVKE